MAFLLWSAEISPVITFSFCSFLLASFFFGWESVEAGIKLNWLILPACTNLLFLPLCLSWIPAKKPMKNKKERERKGVKVMTRTKKSPIFWKMDVILFASLFFCSWIMSCKKCHQNHHLNAFWRLRHVTINSETLQSSFFAKSISFRKKRVYQWFVFLCNIGSLQLVRSTFLRKGLKVCIIDIPKLKTSNAYPSSHISFICYFTF